MADAQKVIATAGLISVSVGSANSVIKYKRPPSTRFLIGSGIAFLVLSAMGNTESLGEVAKGLAVGVMTTILLGEGGGVLTYFIGERESDTRKPGRKDTTDGQAEKSRSENAQTARARVRAAVAPSGSFRRDIIPLQPFHPFNP